VLFLVIYNFKELYLLKLPNLKQANPMAKFNYLKFQKKEKKSNNETVVNFIYFSFFLNQIQKKSHQK
jgi:hypothetical protein